jgi:hypothetical protein
MVIAIGARMEWGLGVCASWKRSEGGVHSDDQQVQSADRWVPPNPVILSKSACRRTAKLNVTWEGKGLGRVHVMASCGTVVTERDMIDSKVDCSQPPA